MTTIGQVAWCTTLVLTEPIMSLVNPHDGHRGMLRRGLEHRPAQRLERVLRTVDPDDNSAHHSTSAFPTFSVKSMPRFPAQARGPGRRLMGTRGPPTRDFRPWFTCRLRMGWKVLPPGED